MSNQTLPKTTYIWDPFIRIYHWLIVIIVVSNYWFFEGGDEKHNDLGYIAAGLVLFRILWGFIGPKEARWKSFLPTLSKLKSYTLDVFYWRQQRHINHNPMATVGFIFLLALILLLGLTGYLLELEQFWGDENLEFLHELSAHLLIILSAFHILFVLAYSLKFRESLILSMITGKKRSRDQE